MLVASGRTYFSTLVNKGESAQALRATIGSDDSPYILLSANRLIRQLALLLELLSLGAE